MPKMTKMPHLPLRTDWDPMSRKISTGSASDVTISRIKKDILEFRKNPPVGIYLMIQDEDISQLNVLIVGPRDTPYQGGFFHFFVGFGDDYPFQPPRVRLMTTDNGKVRFNPNFYNNGKICLSILHTWSGPQWTASQTLTSVLCSIQSLMTEKPYQNEPGQEEMKATSKRAQDYMAIIRHESIRVAVCDTVEGMTTCPKPFVDQVVKPQFLQQLQYYKSVTSKKRSDKKLEDFLGGCKGPFDFAALETRLDSIKARLDREPKPQGDDRILGLSVSDVGDAKKSDVVSPKSDGGDNDDDDDNWDFGADSDESDLSDDEGDGEENGEDGAIGGQAATDVRD